MKSTLKVILLIIIILTTIPPVQADTNNKNQVNIYFFHSKDCYHCKNETKYLNSIEKQYDNIKIYRYEVSNKENNALRMKVKELYNLKTDGVPLTIIGNTPYIGYNEEKSNIIYTKTIEYYTRYNYIDEVGTLLNIKDAPNYKIEEDIPSLKEFINQYGNFHLIGPLYTNNLDPSLIAIITGILHQFQLLPLIILISILILLKKIPNIKTRILLSITYILINTLFLINTIYQNNIYTLIIQILTLIIFIKNILNYLRYYNKKYLYSNILIIITIISNYLISNYYNTNINILKEIINLNNLNKFSKLLTMTNFIFPIIIINIIFISISNYLNLKKLQ